MKSVVFSALGANPTLPQDCYIDTNAVIDLAFHRPGGNEFADFLTNASANNTLIVYSEHTLNELTDFVHIEVMKGEAQKAGFGGTWKEYENTGVNHGNKVIAKVDEAIHNLELYAGDLLLQMETPDANEVRQTERKFISLGVAPKDARHLALMHLYGMNNIFTRDSGFLRAPNLNIYAASHSLLKYLQKGVNTIPFQEDIPDPD